ncbi:MAG: branched-chain amino acid transaminase [Chloroflexi bacterium]|nr:branched-chain amino acid transaminase [Chloroflexota bacterium]
MDPSPYAYFEGAIRPFADCKISIMNHTFLYGTGVFEGVRGYWDDQSHRLNIFRLREHYERLEKSARILRTKLPASIDELCEITAELCRRNGHEEDIYIRPQAYKADLVIGPELINRTDAFFIFSLPFGKYLEVQTGMHVGVSSWRRVQDNMIPARAKVTGIYVNSSLARTEAMESGFDEAIMLNQNGYVGEGSSENLFLVKNGTLITPDNSDDILEGITRHTIITLAKEELGIGTEMRHIGRTELYTADEMFFTGTGAEVTPITKVDHREIGTGKIGDVTERIRQVFFEVVRGRRPKYQHWLHRVESAKSSTVKQPELSAVAS